MQPKGEEERVPAQHDEQEMTGDIKNSDEKTEKLVSQKQNIRLNDKNELGAAQIDGESDYLNRSKGVAYPSYNFSWAGEQPKGASP